MQPDPRWTTGPASAALVGGLHEQIARTALICPDAVALISSKRTMTYAELDRTADAWAAELAVAAVAEDDIVPIILPRSTELITAAIAVLKTGAAYALLDPAWPEARLAEIVGEFGTSVVITDRDLAGIPAWTPPSELGRAPTDFAPVGVDGCAPCCVFFTSGTTGRPKGVLTPHRAIARLFRPGTFLPMATGTVMPLAAPMPWDAFALELWSALLSGGTSLIIDEPYLSAQSLHDGTARHGVNIAWLTSSLFNMLVDEDLEAFQGLRQVMIGGERLSAGHVARFLRRHPGIKLLNGYGPVESTIFATTHAITEFDCARPGGIPLGRPVPGTEVHVLDGDRPCAVGEVGEICLGGDGLALGYLGDPALTKSKFTATDINGDITPLYRTGDLGMWDHEGLLHFRGRADRQLKIRGHRIEPSDIERQVERLVPRVRSCRVLARRNDEGSEHQLVAFCVPYESGDPLDDVLASLRTDLMPHHRPGAVVSIDAFPVTPQGKLDEKTLLTMASAQTLSLPAELGEGGDPVERLVAETVCSVLGRTAVARDKSFLDIGGSSLGAGRVCARLADRLDRPVPVSRFYEYPTVAGFAEWLRSTQTSGGCAEAIDQTDIPLRPLQLMYLATQLADPDDLTSHCLLTWVIEGELDYPALESAVASVHRRHEPLRASYLADPRPVVRLEDIGPPPLELQSGTSSISAAGQALRNLLAEPLALSEGEVWRTAVVPVAGGQVAVFGCVVHHIAFDGWSEAVLANDIAAAYRETSAGAPAPPSLARIHRNYTERLKYFDRARQENYLRTELAGVPALRWPPNHTERVSSGPSSVEMPVTPALVADVDSRAAECGVNRFVFLLTMWAGILAEVLEQDDFAIGVPIAQRDDAGLEQAVGCHLNMLCIRLRGAALGGGVSAMRETDRIVGRAKAAQDVPYTDVLQMIDVPRTGRPPLFQTLFALQDNAIPHLRLAGLQTEFIRQPYLSLPLELHAEFWLREDGGMDLTVYFRPDVVPENTAQEIVKRFTDRLHITKSGVRP
ncbi:amino acid adenylation domain-containing protein [Nocardia suismassiliense]|uniref:Amino acid adenylation domain-containing protein n=1 Tax=Nocardia suismassiliense TaxID=2077092 RepID=A0ABW6QMG2_9NOCA